jgi:hypothetical protein
LKAIFKSKVVLVGVLPFRLDSINQIYYNQQQNHSSELMSYPEPQQCRFVVGEQHR